MNPFFSFYRFSLITVLTSAGLAAPGEPSRVQTLGEALQRAEDRNPGLAAQRSSGRAAEAWVEQAGLRPNPTLDVAVENVLGTGRAQGVRSLETTVQASQLLERGGKREKRVVLAGRERDQSAAEWAVRRTELRATTAVACAGALVAQQRLALTEEPLRLARETLAAVDLRVRDGAASPAELARARAALAAAQVDQARGRAALTAAQASLAATWGGVPEEVGPFNGSLVIPDGPPVEEDVSLWISQHPRRAVQEAIIASRRASLELAQAQAVQDVTVGGGVRFLREGSDAAFVAGVSVPLAFRNRNQGGIRAARELLSGAELEMRVIENDLRAESSAAWREVLTAHAALQNLRREALPATEDAVVLVRRAYDEGHLPLIDVLDAQRALVALQREILDQVSAYAVALARLEGLTASTFPLTRALLSSE